MDYSLLVGLHFRDNNTGDKMGLSPFLLRTGRLHIRNRFILSWYNNVVSRRNMKGNSTCFSGKNDSYQNEKFMRGCRFLEAELQDMDRILAGR